MLYSSQCINKNDKIRFRLVAHCYTAELIRCIGCGGNMTTQPLAATEL